MNLGDGLLFELEKGKPKLILLSHGEKYPAKLSIRPRAANILSAKQPSCVEEVHGDERTTRLLAGRQREVRYKAKGAASSSTPTTTEGKSTSLTLSKTHNHHKDSVKVEAKVKPIKHAVNNNVGPQRANKKTEQPPNTGIRVGGKLGLKNTLPSGDERLKDIVCLTNEQLQHLLNAAQTLSNGQHAPENQEPQGNETDLKCASSVKEGEDGEIKEEGGGGEKGIKKRGGGTDTTRSSQEKDNGVPACLFSWLEDRQSDSKAAIDARKVQWRRELDEQVALKQQQQQRLAPDRLQAEEYAESVLSVQSSVSLRELPAAIRSSLRLGEITPMEDVLSVERREEQRRRWLEELDHQKEEASERRKREKLLQNQTEDHERWATHFDSLQRRPLVQAPTPSALPPVQLSGSERGEWEPSSSLSLVWEATSSCGAESVIGASVDSTGGYPRTSYLRTMTSLLDPVQIEERERRRLKQLEQQKVIEAQMEERRKQREQEEAKRRREEEEEERRVALEREMLQRQYKLETLKMKQVQAVHQVEPPENGHNDKNLQETFESSKVITQSKDVEDANRSASLFKNTAVQTEAAPLLPLKADEVQIPDVGAQHHPSPSPSVAPSNSRSRGRTGKENMCLPAGDPYEPFVRTERSRRDKRRPEWNTQRPSRRFVPASERYPVAMQKDRQESRLKRQAELLALQERTCLSRTEPSAAQHQELHLCPSTQQTRTSPAKKVETGNKGNNISTTINTDRGRSPAVPAVRHKVQSQQVSTTLHPLPPVLEFIPYVRTDEVFHLDPLEPADTPPPHTHSGAPPTSSASPPAHRDPLLHPELLRNTHTQRQQEILRGLAQLRQGLLQKQKELETDLNPLLNHHGNEQRLPSTTHRM
ncbi:coiled-coil domain-containing protein 66 isoform X2 [Melanotaenia boesemani]|uniref:coiled-coil domain-containing protein 66 isoform X2 n=1 Tax=Melanotaenia boesemani TaxID=1250792 RepID=UPI001C05E199|nr:coiled-coil domain-containing protein 66 isoform X2 [Melanotaenia boesemani]